MGSFNLQIEGLGDALKKLKQYEGEKKKAISNEIKAAAFDIEADAKAAAPVDLGFLRQNIRVGEVTGTSAEVESGANYSAYVEFGTGGLVDVPSTLEGYKTDLEPYAMQFKGAGIKQINLPARPFFFPAVFKHYGKMVEKFKDVMR